jgi:hypothetical protein
MTTATGAYELLLFYGSKRPPAWLPFLLTHRIYTVFSLLQRLGYKRACVWAGKFLDAIAQLHAFVRG